jgi:hypothetical protein
MKYLNVYNASGLLEAESIHIFLESAGIPSLVTQESAGVAFGLTFGPLGQAKVMVAETQAEEALELLKNMDAGAFMSDDSEISEFEDDFGAKRLEDEDGI